MSTCDPLGAGIHPSIEPFGTSTGVPSGLEKQGCVASPRSPPNR